MKVVSLFSGAGGLDLGFVQAGHQIVWANDIDEDCVNSYRCNIGLHITNGDIRAIPSSDIPDCDIVIGGFPCQGFSRANLRRTAEDERNQLYLEFVRVVRDKRPRYIVAENVRGLLSMSQGRVIAMIAQDFEAVGYRIRYSLFNAADFGVPQNRWRVIILGTRDDVPKTLEPAFPEPTHARCDSLFRKRWVTIGEALRGIPEPGEDGGRLVNHVCSRYKVTDRDFTGHRRTDPDKPSPTILARGNGKGGVCAIHHPNNHRRLSVRESAIIQTFPLGFEFHGRLNSMYRQVGNAVPVAFARAVGAQLAEVDQNGPRRSR